MNPDLEICPDCKLVLPRHDGESHAYMGGSPACWALYGQVLAREYGDPAWMAPHRTTVDAYAAQHPGRPEPRAIQSVNGHLVALHLTFDRGLDASFVRKVLSRLARDKGALSWLAPPADLGAITVADVMRAQDPTAHAMAVMTWGQSVWRAWAGHHATVIALAERAARD
jgi:hypothetical protein